jgi:uncharacterized protein (TIGR02284 family)
MPFGWRGDTMAHTDWIGTLRTLIEVCKDGEDGYKEAARRAVRRDLRRYFEEQSSTRASFAVELRDQLSLLGKIQLRGSLAAAVHRGWLDLLAKFGGGDAGVLTAVLEGERQAIADYEIALAAPLPPQMERLARSQLEQIGQVYAELEQWQLGRTA